MDSEKNNGRNEEDAVGRSLYGVHIILEDGDEDATVRPTCLSEELLKELRESAPPPDFYASGRSLPEIHIRIDESNCEIDRTVRPSTFKLSELERFDDRRDLPSLGDNPDNP